MTRSAAERAIGPHPVGDNERDRRLGQLIDWAGPPAMGMEPGPRCLRPRSRLPGVRFRRVPDSGVRADGPRPAEPVPALHPAVACVAACDEFRGVLPDGPTRGQERPSRVRLGNVLVLRCLWRIMRTLAQSANGGLPLADLPHSATSP